MKSTQFLSELRKVIEQNLPDSLNESRIAENLPRLTPNEELRLRTCLGKQKDEVFEILALVSRILGKERLSSWLIREFVEKQNLPNSKVYVQAELDMPFERLIMYFSRNYSERDFYGNFLPKVLKVLAGLKVSLWKPKRAREVVRRRGYRDKGSLCSDSSRIKGDWSLTELQNQIEQERLIKEMTYQFFTGNFCFPT